METIHQPITLEDVKKFTVIAGHIDDSVLITDKDHGIEWVNDSFTQLTGYTLEEARNLKSNPFLNNSETDVSVNAHIREKLSLGKSVTEETINYSKSGRKFWVKMAITPVFNDSGQVEKFICFQTDITDQKQYELKITNMAREMAGLIEHANTPIFGTDSNGAINEWNMVAARLTGYNKAEVYGQNIEKLIADHSVPEVKAMLQDVLNRKAVRDRTLSMKTHDQKNNILLVSALPRKNSAGQITGVLLVGHDITELTEYRVNLEQLVEKKTFDLQQALQKEKELVELKKKFVSIASHEFRTPLSSIRFSAEAIRNYFPKLTREDITQKLLNVEKQVDHMTRLLEDILMVGKTEVRGIKVNRTQFDLKEFTASLIEELTAPLKEKREMRFTFSCKSTMIYSDEKLLRNIVINLLTNALKFSPTNSLVIISLSDRNENVVIEVKDSGMGIAEEELDTVFEAFQRGSNVTAVSGTGLGLSIVKKAVELLGGTIEIQSKLGQGTTMKVVMPTTPHE